MVPTLLLSWMLACDPGPRPYRPHAERDAALDVPAEGVFSPKDFVVQGLPQPGEWLMEHPEPGQDVQTFQREVVRAEGRPLLLVPLGQVEGDLDELAQVAGTWLGVTVEVRDLGLEVAGLPGRIHPRSEEAQLYTAPVLDLLRERLPEDAFGALAVTDVDLTPGDDWNFVFGQAHYTDRVGVFSFARHRPEGTSETQAFRRALRTLTHEAGHMLGMRHCPWYECAMNGSNSLSESDASPLHLCPIDLRKLQLATDVSLEQRYQALAPRYQAHGLLQDAAFVQR